MMTDRVAQVSAWMDERAEDMARLLERLVAVESENPPGRALGRCADVLREEMDRLGLSPEILTVTGAPGEWDPRGLGCRQSSGPALTDG
ncbi:hypothetical protein FAF44_36205 [Nonomuraea sp. MG754425]|uniref:hypothetical protein n=1 Tax=Nonomuraea sp. MG754425 TaxID=2570319 RepID=UPI001F3D03A7|nr:hypothetical protein [Nonomuraea sp. MG754425]MCF6473788.1 hypothetical protein [Nonomuraea sp. MG754425]